MDEVGQRSKDLPENWRPDGFDAVKFALKDFRFRVTAEVPKLAHSHVNAVRYEGGLLDEIRIPFSPEMELPYRYSGERQIVRAGIPTRYALDIDFGEEAADIDYKDELLDLVTFSKAAGK